MTGRAVIVATGAKYRKLPLENLARFATFMEAQLCMANEVIVVDGGNSAGLAAIFLEQTARRVQPDLRWHPVLRQLAPSTRHRSRQGERAPGDRLRRAR